MNSLSELDPASPAQRLFVVGDVHLHARSPAPLAADLARFAAGVTQQAPGAQIILNGDVFDLDRLDASPADLPDSPEARVERILRTWPVLVLALREHLRRGGRLCFIAGNHDAELLLPRVQASVRAALEHRIACLPVQFAQAVCLGQIWIEHGHQVDPDSAFDPDLHVGAAHTMSAFPLASLMTRWFVSRHNSFDRADLHQKPPLAVLLGVLRSYKLAGLLMALHYPFVAARIVAVSAWFRLRQRTRHSSLSTMAHPWSAARRLYLDRYIVFCLAALLLLGLPWTAAGRPWWWVFAGLAAYLVMPPARRRTFAQRDVRRCRDEARARMHNGAKLVVFGHTHQAFVEQIGASTYANHGAFSSPVTLCPPARGAGPQGRPFLSISQGNAGCELKVLASSDNPAGSREAIPLAEALN